MNRFKFSGSAVENEYVHEVCGIEESVMDDLIKTVKEAVDESITLVVEHIKSKETFEMDDLRTPLSALELAQAVAEKIEGELTPEKSFLIGLLVSAELSNEGRHYKVLSEKLNQESN